MAKVTMKAKFGVADVVIETGRIAKQASSVLISQGETVVLVTCGYFGPQLFSNTSEVRCLRVKLPTRSA